MLTREPGAADANWVSSDHVTVVSETQLTLRILSGLDFYSGDIRISLKERKPQDFELKFRLIIQDNQTRNSDRSNKPANYLSVKIQIYLQATQKNQKFVRPTMSPRQQ
jgi:hypothetical protein